MAEPRSLQSVDRRAAAECSCEAASATAKVVAHLVAEAAAKRPRVGEQRDREERDPSRAARLSTGGGCGPPPVVPRAVPPPRARPRCRAGSAGNSAAARRRSIGSGDWRSSSMRSLSSSRASARYERAGMQRDRSAGARLHFLQDRVAVALAVGQRQQDLEGDRRQRQEGVGPEFVHVCFATIRSTHIDGQGRKKVAEVLRC